MPIYASTPPDLVAYSEDLEEKWRVSLPVPTYQGMYPCVRPAAALDDDGVLYLAVEADGASLIAVQTRSPGLAQSPWPLWYRNHSGSVWAD